MSGTAAEFEGIKQAALLRLPGATPEVVDAEARWVLHEFLSETRVWWIDASLPLLPESRDYAVPLPVPWASAAVLLTASVDHGPALTPGLPMNDGATGFPSHVGLVNDRTLRVYPTPTLAEFGRNLTFRVALTVVPNDAAVEMPERLRPYHRHILDGLLARMYSIPDKTWTNTRMADPHQRRFVAAINMVRRELDGARTYGTVVMRGPRFGR